MVGAVARRSGMRCLCRAHCCDRLLGQRGCRSKVRISRHHRASTSWLSTTTHSSSSWQGRSASSESKCRTQGRAEQKGRGFLYKYIAFVTAEFRASRIYGGPTTVLTAKTARRNSIHVIRHYYLDVDLQFFTAVLGSDFDLGNFSCGN